METKEKKNLVQVNPVVVDKSLPLGFNAKELQKKAAEDGLKFKRRERLKVEIVKPTRYYKKGDILEMLPLYGQALIKNKFAKKVPKE